MSIEVSRQQEHQLRRMGREAVSKAIKAANEGTGGMRRVTAKVTKVNADYTIDVDMGDSQYAMPITGLRYTTACAGVAVGDTVLVDVVGHLATVTGILATSDNGPYVPEVIVRQGCYHVGIVGPGSGANVTVPLSMPSTDYAISITNATGGSGWTKACFSAPNNLRKEGFDVAVWNDAQYTTLNVWFWWFAFLVR